MGDTIEQLTGSLAALRLALADNLRPFIDDIFREFVGRPTADLAEAADFVDVLADAARSQAALR